MTKVEIAQKRLEIARLRNLAGWQRGKYAENHRRQAETPIYPGQEIVCIDKAAQAVRMAAQNEARADLIEAELAEAEEESRDVKVN